MGRHALERLAPSADELRTIADVLDRENLAAVTTLTIRVVDGSPWVEFDSYSFDTGLRKFAIWRYTGAPHRVGEDGAVEDDPIEGWPCP